MDENITNGLISMITNSYEVDRNGKISPVSGRFWPFYRESGFILTTTTM